MNLWGIIKISKKFDFQNFSYLSKWDQNFSEIQFLHENLDVIVFFSSNLNLEWFQLSFDVHFALANKKLWIFENCHVESWNIFEVKLAYFSDTLQQN